VRAGLGVLLTVPRTADPDRLVRVAGAAEEADLPHAVAFTGRGDEGYAALEQTAAAADSAPWRQVTVAGWPAGGPPRAELVDLVRRVAGDVVAVCAEPGAMPAPSLGEELPVTLALLTERGTTVLASERFAARQAASTLTLVGPELRCVLQGDALRVDGEVREVRRGDAAAAVALAAGALSRADPSVADLHDLAVATRVLAAVEESRREGGWVELG